MAPVNSEAQARGRVADAHASQSTLVPPYPRGARDVTLLACGPWLGVPLLGRPIAAAIHASGMAPREWLAQTMN